MAKVKLIKEGIILFDPTSKITWINGAIREAPLTPFVVERLGKYLELVEETTKVPITIREKPKPELDEANKTEVPVTKKKKYKTKKVKKK